MSTRHLMDREFLQYLQTQTAIEDDALTDLRERFEALVNEAQEDSEKDDEIAALQKKLDARDATITELENKLDAWAL